MYNTDWLSDIDSMVVHEFRILSFRIRDTLEIEKDGYDNDDCFQIVEKHINWVSKVWRATKRIFFLLIYFPMEIPPVSNFSQAGRV